MILEGLKCSNASRKMRAIRRGWDKGKKEKRYSRVWHASVVFLLRLIDDTCAPVDAFTYMLVGSEELSRRVAALAPLLFSALPENVSGMSRSPSRNRAI